MEAADKKRRITTIICVVLLLALMVYLFKDVFTSNYQPYKTQTADEIVQQDKITLESFVFRDEAYINDNASGTVIPLVSDGKRVSKDDPVALVCKSEEQAGDYAALQSAKAERERYIALSNQTELNTIDMQKLNSEIDNTYAGLVADGSTGDYSGLSDYITELEDELASKQILMDGSVDFSAQIADVDKRIAALEAKKISPSEVKAPMSGYFISTVDGYENTVSYADAEKMGVADVEKALKAKPVAVSGKMGKIVGSYKWYIASVIGEEYTRKIEEGMSMKINIPYCGLEKVPVVVERVSEVQNGKAAIVFSCTLMNETYANIRNADIELIFHEYTGFRIPATAVRSEKLEDGRTVKLVYILRGDIMSARAVEIVYTPKDGDYLIVKADMDDVTRLDDGSVIYYAIDRYDEVIVKGRKLENGKSIG